MLVVVVVVVVCGSHYLLDTLHLWVDDGQILITYIHFSRVVPCLPVSLWLLVPARPEISIGERRSAIAQAGLHSVRENCNR